MRSWLQIYLVPGAVFVSVVMGGGYGTGREVVEYFTQYGLQGGLLGIGVATLAFAVILCCTFDYARVHGAYDYRSFFEHLLGRYWWLFEVLYAFLFLLVLGVVSSAAGDMFEQHVGIPSSYGITIMLLLVAGLVLLGRHWLEGILTYWSVAMYGVFGLYFYQVLMGAQVNLAEHFRSSLPQPGWLLGGLLYAMYNVAIAPVLLFTTRGLSSRGQAIGAGLIAALLVMLPALAFHISYAVDYPGVLEASLPNYAMIEGFAPHWLLVLFLIALVGTLIETGAGLVQGVVERVGQALASSSKGGRRPLAVADQLSAPIRGGIAVVALGVSGALSSVGIVALIAKGYSLMAIGFGLVYVLPLLWVTARSVLALQSR